MKRSKTAVLFGANFVLIGVLVWLWFGPGGREAVRWTAPAPIKPSLGQAMVAATPGAASAARFASNLERPVFSLSRRAVAAAKPASAPQAEPLAGVHLYGVLRGAEGATALMRVEGKSRRLRISETVGEWTLKQIGDRAVTFARGAERRELPLVQVRQGQSAVVAPTVPKDYLLPTRPVAPAAQSPNPAPGASRAQPAPKAAEQPAFVTGASRK